VPTPAGPAALDAIVAAARHVVDEVGAKRLGPVAGVGVGLPGLVGIDGVLRGAPHLQGLIGLQLRAPIAEALDLPVVLDNDATCAAWAEVVVGAGRGAADVLLVTLGTGIGGGLVVDGALYDGAHGFAGEPGHMVVDPAGPPCPCGRNGCWERYASGHGLARLARLAVDRGDAPGVLRRAGDPDAIEGEHVVASARAGEPGAQAVIDEFSVWLAAGLANLVALLDPELVLVGGGLADVADLFLDRTRAAYDAEVFGGVARTPTRIEVATLGSDAGAIGAALRAVVPPASAVAVG
jgi:glucokinase